MLSLIRIRNYAVIDEIEVDFESGLSVMTGETGAGKSILVDALGLALGDRADATTVRPGADRAEISVLFECPQDHPAIDWLKEHGLDEDLCCLLRRVISAEGRSRAFINSHPVTLQDLRTLGSLLVNIHGQHAHQALLQTATQRDVLDFHGDHLPLVRAVAETFKTWKALQLELSERQQSGEGREAELEALKFRTGELEELELQPGELEPLKGERNRLGNVDRLAASLNSVLGQIYEGDDAAAHLLVANAHRELTELAELDPDLGGATELLGEAEIHLREVASELAHYRARLEPDPQRLEWVETRLARIRELATRHKVEDEALGEVLETLKTRIEQLEGTSESLSALEQRVEHAATAYFEAAEKLTAARAASAVRLGQEVTAQIAELGLPHGEFRVSIQPKPVERADTTGLDQIEFQVALNPGQEFGPLSRVASGGELSRVSLAVEVVTAGATTVATMVFDEVDAGIGGGVAEMVGRRLAELAAQRQVLCVTHLAQVATQGRHHYRVVKLTDGQTSRTNVRELGPDERIEELSRMLGGLQITDRTRAHAQEMIERAAR